MHTVVLLAVEAEDKDDAIAKAEHHAHEQPWSDWSEHGGRWSDLLEGSVLCYADDPVKFTETVNTFLGFTKKRFDDLMKQVGHYTVGELATNPELNFPYSYGPAAEGSTDEERKERLTKSLSLFRATKLLELISGASAENQHFYDVQEFTNETRFMEERIAKDPKNQFIVVWDFHS